MAELFLLHEDGTSETKIVKDKGDTLNVIQTFLGGYFEILFHDGDVVVIANENSNKLGSNKVFDKIHGSLIAMSVDGLALDEPGILENTVFGSFADFHEIL